MFTLDQTESARRPYETLAAPDQVTLYDLVAVKGSEGQPLDAYRDVRRRDASEIVSVVSRWYQFVPHREVADFDGSRWEHGQGSPNRRRSVEARKF